MTQRVLVATTNLGKVREFSEALGAEGIDVVGLDALGPVPDVEETGATFEANARIKAEAYSRCAPLVTLADDSGLEVDALDGAPGVLSARFGGPGMDDDDRNRELLKRLKAYPDPRQRGARFRCALAVARGGKTLAVFEGSAEGIIVEQPRGEGGFGYDPLFYYPDFGCTFGEVPGEKKRTVSHRGRALAAFVQAVQQGMFSGTR